MKRIIIFPYNSVILFDLVRRCGHEPLTIMDLVEGRMGNGEALPPYNVKYEDAVDGLKYCPVEVPSGVRGRVAVLAPLVEEAEAAIFTLNPKITGSRGNYLGLACGNRGQPSAWSRWEYKLSVSKP